MSCGSISGYFKSFSGWRREFASPEIHQWKQKSATIWIGQTHVKMADFPENIKKYSVSYVINQACVRRLPGFTGLAKCTFNYLGSAPTQFSQLPIAGAEVPSKPVQYTVQLLSKSMHYYTCLQNVNGIIAYNAHCSRWLNVMTCCCAWSMHSPIASIAQRAAR